MTGFFADLLKTRSPSGKFHLEDLVLGWSVPNIVDAGRGGGERRLLVRASTYYWCWRAW